MKYIAFILVSYFMGMIMFPCSDDYAVCKSTKSEIGIVYDHNHMADANDNCSPFCNCTCCHTTVDNKFLAKKKEDPKPLFKEKKFIFAHQNFVPSYYGNIWQPPKINS